MPLIQPNAVIGGAPMNVTDLLKSNHSVPPYQRDFVWQERTVNQLWDDLTEHYERNTVGEHPVTEPEGYFLGAMVVISHGNNEPFEVVDGQQRLATLSTVVSVLYSELQTVPTTHYSKIGLEQRLREMLGKFDGEHWLPNLSFPDAELQNFFVQSCLLQVTMAQPRRGNLWVTGSVSEPSR
jgi:hypothetical protein